VRPLKDGVIADFDMTEAMLAYFINKLNVKGFLSKPNILICCPTNITSIEQKAIVEAAEKSGGGKVFLEFEPKVAAVGAGMDIFQPRGNMVIDIGGGTSDIAVLSMGEVVTSRSLRLAGDRMNAEIAAYVKRKHNLLIGEHTAETIKLKIGSVWHADASEQLEVRGRDIVGGLPVSITIGADEVELALHETMMAIVAAAKEVLEVTPPELAGDIIDRGIMLTGGGALLRNIANLFSEHLKVPVVLAEKPLDAVALGTGVLLENIAQKRAH
jgi:rod shape-determining protein MreB